jgi:hypothetical protein
MKYDIHIKVDRGFVIMTIGDLATLTFTTSNFITFARECNIIAAPLTGEK